MAAPIELRILGSIDLGGGDGPEARLVLAHPKRLALLSYLAVHRPHAYHRRDELYALLWPEADAERARNSLRQAVHQIRRALGQDVITGRGDDEIALSQRVECDAAEFARRIAADDVAGALALYRGDLLASFHAGDAPGFEEWLEAERGRLRSLACGAAWTLSRAREAAGAGGEAATWARWAASREPLDEVAQQRLIATLDRLGDRAGALRAYEEFAVRLRAEFEADPAAETQALIAGVRARSTALAPATRHGPGLAPETGRVRDASGEAAPRRSRAWQLYAAGALTVLVLATVWGRARSGRPGAPLDAGLVAVAPFRVAGADSSLGFLREGMLDLLATALTGEGGLRATDPRTVVSAWPRVRGGGPADLPDSGALQRARGIGAGYVLVGSVVGTREQLTLTGRLLDTWRGGTRAQVTVTGRLDSLPRLVDALAARLLSQGAAEPALRLASLAGVPLPALKAYLDGRRAFRAGLYDVALLELWRAVALDSTFASAWLELVRVADWIPGSDAGARAGPRAWSLRGRLGAADRAQLVAALGPGYPAPTTHGQRLAAWEDVVRLAPEQPEAWYGLGDTRFHLGRLLGRDSGFAQAEPAFARAVALDSAFTAPLVHLVQIAVLRGDLPAARRLAALYASRDSTSESAAYVRWRVAVALGDSATSRAIEAGMDTLPVGVLNLIAGWASQDGVAVETAWRAARTAVRRASGPDADYAMRVFMVLAANLGRFAERESVRQRWLKAQSRPTDRDAEIIEEAMVLDGDSVAGRAALARLQAGARRSRSESAACASASWILLRVGAPADTAGLGAAFLTCVRQLPAGATLGLRALFAARTGAPSLERLLVDVDSARLASTTSGAGNFWSLVEGEARMMRGEYGRARDAFRRREMGSGEAAAYWATMLRSEGRAAELAGDTLGAVHAYRHYLALRDAPDPAARAFADSVRASLARLERSSRS